MPLARVITDSPEIAHRLFEKLQQQGYAVEIAQPGDACLSPVDLEIELENCTPEEALARAARLARLHQADIAIETGALTHPVEHPANDEPVAPAPTTVADFLAAGEPVLQPESVPNAEALLKSELILAPASAVDFETAPAAELDSSPDELSSAPVSLTEAAESKAPVPDQKEAALAASPSFASTVMQFSGERWTDLVAALRQPLRRITGNAVQTVSRSVNRTRTAIRQSAAVLGNGLAMLWIALSRSARSVWLRGATLADRIRQQLADFRAARAEATRRRAEMLASAQAEAARQQPVISARPSAPQPDLAESTSQPLQQAAPRPTGILGSVPPAPRPEARNVALPSAPGIAIRNDRPQWRAMLAGAVAASALFAVGLAVAAMSPRAPLPPSFESSAGGVTVQGGGVTVQGRHPGVSVQAGTSSLEAKPAATRRAGIPRPSPAIRSTERASSNDVTVRHVQRPTGNRIAVSEDQDDDAQDVTVRHFTPVQPAAPKVQQAGIKHYSDISD